MSDAEKSKWKEIFDTKNNNFKPGAADRLLKMDHATVNAIKYFMKHNARDIKANQLRNIHARIRQASSVDQLPLLRVKLAYIKGKSHHRSAGYHSLLDLMDTMLEGITEPQQLRELATFFESVLAYHKYYENEKTRR